MDGRVAFLFAHLFSVRNTQNRVSTRVNVDAEPKCSPNLIHRFQGNAICLYERWLRTFSRYSLMARPGLSIDQHRELLFAMLRLGSSGTSVYFPPIETGELLVSGLRSEVSPLGLSDCYRRTAWRPQMTDVGSEGAPMEAEGCVPALSGVYRCGRPASVSHSTSTVLNTR